MKGLTFFLLFVLFIIRLFNPAEQENPNGFEITINGQVVNKLGETSQSTQNVLVEYIRNDQVRGNDLTNSSSAFTINGVVTGIEELALANNGFEMKGPNPYNYETRFEVSVSEPGRIIASSINGQVKEVMELPEPGVYEFSYDGMNSTGVDIISVQTPNWQKSRKLANNGNHGSEGLEMESFQEIIPNYSLKSAQTETDSLRISGENISTTYSEFFHQKQNLNVGQRFVNQGPEITGTPNTINTPVNVEASQDLSPFVYNDEESQYIPRDANFTMNGSTIKFSSDSTGTYNTIVDVIDGEDPNLAKELEVKFNVVEGDDVTPPTISIDTIYATEDQTTYLNLDESASDNKTASENINWTISDGNNTSTSIDGRIANFTPTPDFSGEDIVSAVITDEAGNQSSKNIIIAYEEVPDTPVAQDDNITTEFETQRNIDPLINDVDPDDDIDPSKTTSISQPSNGTLENNGNGTFSYTPNEGFEGNDSFSYSIEDQIGLKDTANVNITVSTNPNYAPELSQLPDETTNEDIPKTGVSLDDYVNDDNTSKENMQYEISLTNPDLVDISLNENREIVYQPKLNQYGSTDITITATDEGGLSDSFTYTYTINPVNDAPSLEEIADINFDEDQQHTGTAIQGNDVEDTKSELTLTAKSNNPNINVSLNENWNPSYSATTDYNGSGEITYTLTDNEGATDEKTVNVTINPVNDPVEASADISNIILEIGESTNIDLKTKFEDVEYTDLQLTYGLEGLSLGNYSITDGILNIEATTIGNETDLRANASDESTSAYSNYFSLTVNNLPNTAPNVSTIPNDSGNEDIVKTGATSLDAYVSDDYTSDANINWSFEVSNPSKLSVALDANRKPIYTPSTDENGSVQVTATATDEGNLSDSFTYTYTINPVDDAPRFSGTIADKTSNEDVNNVFDEGSRFEEVDGENLGYTIKNLPAGWNQSWNESQVTISSPADYNGTISGLTIEASDPQNNSVESNQFSITRTAVNDPVEKTGDISNIVMEVGENTQIDLKPIFEDKEYTDLELTHILEGYSLGSYTVTDAIMTITATSAGSQSVRTKASDESTSAYSNYFNITANNPANTAPNVSTIPNDSGNEDQVKTGATSLDAYVSDDYTNDANIDWSFEVSDESKLSVALDANRKPIYTPAADENGTVDITATATDEGGLSDSFTYTYTINPVDDAPRFSGTIADKTSNEDINNVFDEGSRFEEVDGENLGYTIKNLPAGWNQSWNESQVTISSPENYFGTITGLVIEAEDENNNAVQSNQFSITRTAVNDPVTFSGTIDNIVLDKDQSTQIDLKNYFDDVEYTDLELAYGLEGLSLGTYSITDGVLTITGTTPGSETDLRTNASDEGTNANSNYFGLTVNEVAQTSTVTFDFRKASTDTRLSTGTSTLEYRIPGGTWQTVTDTDGLIEVELEAGQKYEVEVDHTDRGGPYAFYALRRPGDNETFDQQDANDDYQEISVAAVTDQINAYIILNDFPMADFITHAGYDGSKKVHPDKEMDLWWNANYEPSNATQRSWVQDVQNQVASIPYVMINLLFTESTTAPSGVYLEVEYNNSLGNSTGIDANNYIVGATASYPTSSPPR